MLQDVTLGLVFGVAVGFVASRLLPRGGPARRASRRTRTSLYALGRRLRRLRRRRRCRRTATASSPCTSARSRSASGGPTSRKTFEERAEDIVEIVKLGDLRRVRLAADLRRACSTTAGPRWRSSPSPCSSRGRSRSSIALVGHASRRADASVHGLVRAQGRGDDDVLAARPRDTGIAANERLFNLAALAVFVLDHRARPDRHAGRRTGSPAASGWSAAEREAADSAACSAACVLGGGEAPVKRAWSWALGKAQVGAPGGTRSAAGRAAAGPRGCRAGRSRRARRGRARRGRVWRK